MAMSGDGQRGAAGGSRQRLLTSDYESSDSPSSSEHGEHVVQRSGRRRDAVPNTTDDADHDISDISPPSPPFFHVQLSHDQVPLCFKLMICN